MPDTRKVIQVTSSENGMYFDYKQDGFLEKSP